MFDFRVLRALDLRNADGVELRSVLAQPKRVALLAYLAVSGSYVRRDSLCALLWPESDTEHARGSLRNALHFLRRSLGEGVIVTRGDEEVAIDPARLRCDAAEFVHALAAGEPARALELYRGDLLEGFFLTGVRAFEEWLEAERTELRGQACAAAWRLVGDAEAAGDRAGAVQFARRAVALSRAEESAARRLIALLGRIGDREGALRAYDELVERLAREYEVEPAPETQALVADLRAPPSAARMVVPSADLGLGGGAGPGTAEPAEAALAAPARRPIAAVSAPVWRGPRGVLVLLLALALGGVVVFAGLRTQAAAPVSTNVVAVLPFAYHGSGASEYLSEAIVRLLSTNLNGAGDLRTVDPRALLSALGTDGLEGSDPRHGRALAARFGAGTYVLGHIVEAGERLRITAVIYDPDRADPAPIDEVTVEGGTSELLELVDRLTASLLAGRSGARSERLQRLAALTTHSLPALKAYLEGERAYHAGRYAAALEAFQRAVERDTSFALAYYRLSNAAHWLESQPTRPAAERALQLSGRLSRHDRLLVEAWQRYTSRAPALAERTYRAVLVDHPDDVEAWFQLGEVLFHWGPSYGTPAAAARTAFERVLSYEPRNAGALIHLARIAGMEGRTTELDSLVRRFTALEPAEDQALELAALRATALADSSAWSRVSERLPSATDPLLTRIVNTLAVTSGDLARAATVAQGFDVAAREAIVRAHGQFTRARLELARGRWHAARAELAALDQHHAQILPLWTVEYRAVLATFPFLRVPRAELEAIRDEIARSPAYRRDFPAERVPPSGFFAPGIYAPRRLYLLGILNVRLGEARTALGIAGELEAFAGGGFDSAFAHEFARILRAHVAWLQGEPAAVLQLLGEPRVLPDSVLPRVESYPQADERWLRAEALRQLGRDEEATRWYATFPDPVGYDLMYLAPAHLRRAGIHERRGQRQQAAEHYARFLRLWQDADDELQPLLVQARDRLSRVPRERGARGERITGAAASHPPDPDSG